MTLPGRLRAVAAGFDTAALQAFPWPAPGPDLPDFLDPPEWPEWPEWPTLRHWCLAAPNQPLLLAVPAPEARATAAERAAAVGLELDGTRLLMDGRGPLARLALRLRVKWQDLRGGMPDGRVWDSGRVPPTAAAHAALQRFVPRRPSLIVVDSAAAADVQRLAHALRARSASFACPVRVLWLGPAPGPGWAQLPA